MRLQVLSDLHLESATLSPPQTDADVVVLAGDIDQGERALDWIERYFPRQEIIYVLGNKEYYFNSFPELGLKLIHQTHGSHIHILEQGSVTLGEFTFLGCTLWSDFYIYPYPELPLPPSIAKDIDDFHYIDLQSQPGSFTPGESVALFQDSLHWLTRELKRHSPDKTVVITHHPPSIQSLPLTRPDDDLDLTNLEAFIQASQLRLWIHGHLHHNSDYRIGATRIFSNQRGTARLPAQGFKPELVLAL